MANMELLRYKNTTYSDGRGGEYPAILVSWAEVTKFLGELHTGDPEQDERLVDGLLAAGAPDWVREAPGWIDEHGWGLYRAGRPCLPYQVLEDNAGGLHLAVFDGDVCIYYAFGLEHNPDSLHAAIEALRDGGHPLQDSWESDLPDGYTAQQLYDELTSHEYGLAIIADDAGVYPERMGAAGQRAFDLDD
jgi:hypothetical protein